MTELLTLLTDLVAIDSVNPDLVPGGAGEARLAEYIARCVLPRPDDPRGFLLGLLDVKRQIRGT